MAALDVSGTIATPSLQIQNVGTSTGTAFKILRGSVAQVTGTAQRTINFGYTFSTPPVLCINAVYVVSGQGYRFFASTEQVTTTSFTYTLLFTSANNSTVYSGGDQHTLNWIAIGV